VSHPVPATRLPLSLRVLGGTLGGEWERERRDTLLLMGAIALTVAPHVPHLPAWCSMAFAVLFLWRLGLLFSGRTLPGTPVRLVAAAASCIAVLAQYDTLLGRDAGVALLVLFLGLKLLEMRARRDAFVILFLCFFLLLTAFFHSQSLPSALLAGAAVAALLAAMLTLQFGQREVPVSRRLRMVGAMLAKALPVAAVLFVLFPRLSGPLWGMPEDAHAGRTGLSDTMSPGQIGRLARNEDVAFRVSFDGAQPAPADMYWRGPSLGHFDGRTWRAIRAGAAPVARPQASLPPGGSALRYRTTLEPHNRRWLFALDVPVELPRGPGLAVALGPEFEVLAAEPVNARVRFDVASRLDAAIGLNETPATLRPWLQLPAGEVPRTVEMAGRWLQEESDPARLALRALAMFRDNAFRYTLTPPLVEDDPVDRFLFETRAGFCEHFASAFVVLMRALGIPARVVTGYQGAEPHPEGGYWIVRQADAHAWAEVWLEGRGWVRVDPTGAVAPERIERGAAMLDPLRGGRARDGLAGAAPDWLWRWRLSLDAMTHGWNQWVLSYDRGRQQALLSRLGLDATDPREVAGALAVALAVILGAVAATTLHPRRRRDPVERAYAQFCDRLAAIGAPRQRDETASRYLHRVDRLLDPGDAAHARDIVAAYNRLRYDPPAASADRVRRLSRLVRTFRPR
jgi:transglutaminase-like putative cysteine protease